MLFKKSIYSVISRIYLILTKYLCYMYIVIGIFTNDLAFNDI